MAIKNNQIILFIFIFSSLAFANFLKSMGGKRPLVKISKQDSAINISDELISVFDLGQRRLISDFFWITTLLESDLEHYKNKDNNSWMFLRFNTIATLDPLFLKNYQFGAQYLSIIKDDLYGAELLFKKGQDRYPDDYLLNFNYAFLLAFELNKFKEAVPIYEKIEKMPNPPPFIHSLIIKLKHQIKGDLKLTYELMNETLKHAQNEIVKTKLKADLYAIKAALDLKCLNSKSENCNKLDYEKKPYIFKNKKWQAPKKYKEYKLHTK